MQGHQIDFGIDRGGLRVSMAQDLCDLAERGAATEHLGRQRVAQQVSPLRGRNDSSAAQGTTHYATDSTRAKQCALGGARSDEHITRVAVGAPMAQVVNQGRSDIRRQRQTICTLCGASDANGPFGPIKVIQRQVDHFAGTQSET